MTDSSSDLRRRWSRVLRPAVLLLPLALTGLVTSPAAAVPEGFSDPDPVTGLQALLVYVFAPLAVVAVVVLLATLPGLVGSAKAAPGITDVEPDPGYGQLESGEPDEGSLEALFSDDEGEPSEESDAFAEENVAADYSAD